MARFLLCRSFVSAAVVATSLLLGVGSPLQAEERDLAARVSALEARLRDSEQRALERSDLHSVEWINRGSFALRIGGFVQADAVVYRQDSEDQLDGAAGLPLNETRFLIRRARLRAEAASKYVGGALEIDGNTVSGTQARLLGAEVFAQWPSPSGGLPLARATLGLFKIPFGREVLMYDPERLFMERSLVVRSLFPGEYDLGFQLSGGFRFLRYALAVMNGEPSGESQFAARDPNQSKDLVGRAGVETLLARLVRLRGGLSGVFGQGFSPGKLAGKDVLSWRDDNDDGQVQLSEILVVRGEAAVASQNYSRDALGMDAEVAVQVPKLGVLEIAAEIIFARNLDRATYPADPIASGRDLREFGYYASLTQEITPLVRVGVRYDFYDPDADRQQQLGVMRIPVSAAFSTLSAALAVQHPRYGRISAEYQNQRNALGRSASGVPTTLGKDSVMLRAQVMF